MYEGVNNGLEIVLILKKKKDKLNLYAQTYTKITQKDTYVSIIIDCGSIK